MLGYRVRKENLRVKVLEGGFLIGLKGYGWYILKGRDRGDISV